MVDCGRTAWEDALLPGLWFPVPRIPVFARICLCRLADLTMQRALLLFVTVQGLASLSSLEAHAQVNKCKGLDGKVTYSDRPCLQTETRSAIDVGDPLILRGTTTNVEVEARRKLDEAQTSETLRRKLERLSEARMVAPGMNASQVRWAWGPPTTINITRRGTTDGEVVEEQWIYEPRWDRREKRYVYLEDGIVQSATKEETVRVSR